MNQKRDELRGVQTELGVIEALLLELGKDWSGVGILSEAVESATKSATKSATNCDEQRRYAKAVN